MDVKELMNIEDLTLEELSAPVTLRKHGQLTIPDKLRKKLALGEDSYLYIVIVPMVSNEGSMTKDEAKNVLRKVVMDDAMSNSEVRVASNSG